MTAQGDGAGKLDHAEGHAEDHAGAAAVDDRPVAGAGHTPAAAHAEGILSVVVGHRIPSLMGSAGMAGDLLAGHKAACGHIDHAGCCESWEAEVGRSTYSPFRAVLE